MISNCKEFKCSNGICLPFNKVCDGKIDCLDQSDEFGDCGMYNDMIKEFFLKINYKLLLKKSKLLYL